MTRVLIVDDSAFMRHSISRALRAQPDFEVVGVAQDGIEGLELVRRLKPDVITLDIEMPRMDGLKTLELIMREAPVPVVMLSSLTTAGAPATIRALELGAVDFVAKPAPPAVGVGVVEETLLHALRAAAKAQVNAARPRPAITGGKRPPATPNRVADRVVAIGTSTGGPRALLEVVPHLPANRPGTWALVRIRCNRAGRAAGGRAGRRSPAVSGAGPDGGMEQIIERTVSFLDSSSIGAPQRAEQPPSWSRPAVTPRERRVQAGAFRPFRRTW